MALTAELIEDIVRRHGEYLYHRTRPNSVERLFAGEDLRPPTEKDRLDNNLPRQRPRRGCVYLWVPVARGVAALTPRQLEQRLPVRTRWDCLRPIDAILIEEDTVFAPREASTIRDPPLPGFSERFASPPSDLPWPPGRVDLGAWAQEEVPLSWGEWVDSIGADEPDDVYASALRGAVAFRGSIPNGCLEINTHSPYSWFPGATFDRDADRRWWPISELV